MSYVQVTRLRQEYADKMRGLMPAAVQQVTIRGEWGSNKHRNIWIQVKGGLMYPMVSAITIENTNTNYTSDSSWPAMMVSYNAVPLYSCSPRRVRKVITCAWEWKRRQLTIAHNSMLHAGFITNRARNSKCAMYNLRVTAGCKTLSHTQSTVFYWLDELNRSICTASWSWGYLADTACMVAPVPVVVEYPQRYSNLL